MKYICWLNT